MFKWFVCMIAGTLVTTGVETGWAWCFGSAVFAGLWVLSGECDD